MFSSTWLVNQSAVTAAITVISLNCAAELAATLLGFCACWNCMLPPTIPALEFCINKLVSGDVFVCVVLHIIFYILLYHMFDWPCGIKYMLISLTIF